MPLPISRNQVDRLGERLAAGTPSEADRGLLLQVLAAYDEGLAAVEARLRSLGFAVTTRLKTTGTLIDKLRREQGMKLKSVQDIAGARIIVRGSRRDQDEAVARVMASVAAASKPPTVRDRRVQPSSGYRAVHVVVFESGLPVEMQVRTQLQDLWAQVFERLGDRWGRAIRYGGLPDEPDAIALDGNPRMTRRHVVQGMQQFSDEIDRVERARLEIMDVEDDMIMQWGDPTSQQYLALAGDAQELRAAIDGLEAELTRRLMLLVRYATQEA